MRTQMMATSSLNPGGIRIMMDPNGRNEGGSSGDQGGSNYQPGNDGGDQSGDSGEDYGGIGINPASFWDTPVEATQEPKPAAQAQTQNQNGNQQPAPTPGQQEGQRFAQMIDSVAFEPVFTPEVVEALSNGDMATANKAIHSQMQNGIRESIKIMAQVTQAALAHQMAQIRDMIDGQVSTTNQSRDDSALMAKEFTAYNDPASRKVVEDVFKQSLLHTKGDRKAAIPMAKGMLKAMGKAGGEDFGTPPHNPDDQGGNHSGVKSLVESLLGRD